MERLFGEVLPAHPSLQRIFFYRGSIPARFVRLLATSVRKDRLPPLARLDFGGALRVTSTSDRAGAQAIADMIGRGVPITNIRVSLHDAMDADACEFICRAVPRNTHLRDLWIRVKEIFPDTLGSVVASSSLRNLLVFVDKGFPDEILAEIAQQLRTNTTLQGLYLCTSSNSLPAYRSESSRLFRGALEFYNYTLLTFHLDRGRHVVKDAGVRQLLERNGTIQRALEQLEPVSYRVAPTSLWPRAFEVVSTLPTLLYRFLRRGDVNTLCDLLLRDKKIHGQKRGRSIADNDDREGGVVVTWQPAHPPCAEAGIVLGRAAKSLGNQQ
jgi:hypothetical protein